MNDALLAGVLSAVATVVAGKIVSIFLTKRNGKAQTHHPLSAARELADLTATVTDLLSRTSDLESSVDTLEAQSRKFRRERGGD